MGTTADFDPIPPVAKTWPHFGLSCGGSVEMAGEPRVLLADPVMLQKMFQCLILLQYSYTCDALRVVQMK